MEFDFAISRCFEVSKLYHVFSYFYTSEPADYFSVYRGFSEGFWPRLWNCSNLGSVARINKEQIYTFKPRRANTDKRSINKGKK